MRHKNAKNQPLYSKILSKYHFSVVYVVIVYYVYLSDAFFLLNRIETVCRCTTPDFTGPLQYAFIYQSIGTKNQHVHKHYVNFNLSLLIARENRKEREIYMADQSQTIFRSVR